MTNTDKEKSSALRVLEAVDIQGKPDMKGHLYFFIAQGYKGETPVDQRKARLELEHFASILRIAFQKHYPDHFNEFFNRLLSIAQSTFDTGRFRQDALDELSQFRDEVVQAAGSAIKARYTRQLVLWVIIASVTILAASTTLHLVDKYFVMNSIDYNSVVEAEKRSLNKDQGYFSILHTGFLLSAAMWGLLFAWMGRNIEPTFKTLQTPNADLIQPWVRLLFYGIAILVLALLFQKRLVSISFGMAVSTSNISEDPATAVMIGLLLGIAERALPNEVERWSRKILHSEQVPKV